ncbi:T7SS effector LXG polymorphic toxin [Bacillus velezensis]|uniref:T7SS effector LXG polymorphic toxin n=1 Tax=Bacillus velezensis TaxID=492670 RepID=UPI0013644CC7|nr:T7SS effector LXG polymorphic toxin [Bacillus velezensis]MDK4254491.1 T7SS effector LXG polymorphic toxin [Bacillus velezensis]MED3659494.1 T7SS effector LXG polymorphic toxin [Bacillus velezensis]QHK05885.1 Ribonuclease YobL [Bacillus velezensis]QHK11408.1 Ribonuclease YobL [Bacillus velezensis]
MKILDAQSLITSSQQRSKEYQQLREELSDLKKSLEDVSNLGDDFTDRGADNIKAFFNDLAVYTETYMNFTEMQIAFFNSIEGKQEDTGLAGDTFIDEHFVENQLEQGIKNSRSIIDEQQRELSGIFAGISDINHLTPFSSEPVNDQFNVAAKVRRETIDAVYKLDHELGTENAKSEPIEQHIKSFYSALMVATGRGKSALPMYYANKFHESEVYKAHKHIDAEVKTYLRIKKEEAEKRRIKELKAKLDKPGDLSVEDYIDIATEVGYENLTSDQKLYYGQLLQAKSQQELGNQVWNVTKGVGVGLYDVGKDFVTGIYDLVVNPAGTVEAVVTAVIHPWWQWGKVPGQLLAE